MQLFPLALFTLVGLMTQLGAAQSFTCDQPANIIPADCYYSLAAMRKNTVDKRFFYQTSEASRACGSCRVHLKTSNGGGISVDEFAAVSGLFTLNQKCPSKGGSILINHGSQSGTGDRTVQLSIAAHQGNNCS